jgi:hypothetical protein
MPEMMKALTLREIRELVEYLVRQAGTSSNWAVPVYGLIRPAPGEEDLS